MGHSQSLGASETLFSEFNLISHSIHFVFDIFDFQIWTQMRFISQPNEKVGYVVDFMIHIAFDI